MARFRYHSDLAETEDAIRVVYADLTATYGQWVPLADIRANIDDDPGLITDALIELHRNGLAVLAAADRVTRDDINAAVLLDDAYRHLIAFD